MPPPLPPSNAPTSTAGVAPAPPSSSIPGFRTYPSTRNIAPRTTARWLAGKRLDDALGSMDLWRIHDQLYDLTPFIDKHPGGSDWLHVTRGTDITEAFESHHPRIDMVRRMLDKYHVGRAPLARNSPYTFEQHGFYDTLRTRVCQVLYPTRTNNNNSSSSSSSSNDDNKILRKRGGSAAMQRVTDTLAGSFMALLVVVGIIGSNGGVWSTVACVACGTVLALACISAHNFFHQADNWRMYVFDLSLLSSFEWRVSHAISHHLFPNTIYDLEISALEPMFNFLPTTGNSLVQRFGVMVYSNVLYAVLLPIQFIVKLIAIVRGVVKPRIENALPLVELLLLVVLQLLLHPSSSSSSSSSSSLLVSISNGLYLWLMVHLACSWVFAFVGLIAAHHHPDVWHDGDTIKFDSLDWGVQQIAAVRDRHDVTGRLWLVATMFGDHTLHHLFPTVDHAYLPMLYPVLKQTCADFGVPFEQSDIISMAIGKYRQLARNVCNTTAPIHVKQTLHQE
jgi:fatty acid desaturase